MAKEDIDKVCKWLQENLRESYVYDFNNKCVPYMESVGSVTMQEFIDRFRKEMEK